MIRLSLLVALTGVASGCAGVRTQDAADDLRQSLSARTDAPVVWRTDAHEDARADRAVEALLADSLTAEEAVQIALLNNPRMQATYEDVGVAQAGLVQAGLLSNPVFGGRALWALDEGGAPDLGFNVAFEFLDVFWIPLRKRIARSQYEAARLRVAEAVLDLAARTRNAYTRAQADRLRLDLQSRIVDNAEAAYTAALLLREAGTIPAVERLAEQARFEQARLDLVSARQAATESHEALVRTLGLAEPTFALAEAIPPVPEAEGLAVPTDADRQPADATEEVLDVAALQAQALESSLVLDAARHDAEAIAHRLGLDQTQAILPEFEIGGELEREEGEWEAGPEVEVVLPLFDQGQARRATTRSDLRRARAEYRAVAVDVRSATRVLASRLAATRRVALQFQRVVLTLRQDLSQRTLRRYNAMQVGVFGLLQAQEAEAETARAYAEALAAYWTTRTDLDALLAGRMPDLGTSAMPASARTPAREAGH